PSPQEPSSDWTLLELSEGACSSFSDNGSGTISITVPTTATNESNGCFAYQEITGDAQLIAEVTDNGDDSDDEAHCAVTIRRDLTATPTLHQLRVRPSDDRTLVGYRVGLSDDMAQLLADGSPSLGYYLSIERDGTDTEVWRSEDGEDW